MSYPRLAHTIIAEAEEAAGYLRIRAIEDLGLVVALRYEEQAAGASSGH